MTRIWLNGVLCDPAAAVGADDRGLLLGDGVFETVAVMDGRPLRLARHVRRLQQGAKALGIPLAVDLAGFQNAIEEVVSDDGIKEGSARLTLTRGAGPRGILPPADPCPTVLVSASAGKVGGVDPIRAVIAGVTRRNEHSPLSSIKSTNYLDAILARQEADRAGADEAILLNTAGQLAETTIANIFCVFRGVLVTPPVSSGALPGIMRAIILETENVREEDLDVERLFSADEVFVSSSLSVRPIVSIDGRTIGDGTPGQIARRLADLPRQEM